jgi:hypothetical protein
MAQELQAHVLEVLRDALTITVFVFVMMVVVEYLNVLTRGAWQRKLMLSRWRQYALSALLGVVPGDFGPFAVVAMYAHGTVSIGALITVMLAASGDAAFVMLARVPKTAVLIMAALFVLSIVAGALTDLFFGARLKKLFASDPPFEVHEEDCEFLNRSEFVRQWKACTAVRGVLATALALFLVSLATGWAGQETWWARSTMMAVAAMALFIVVTVPDHFLKEHFWEHAARQHVPKIFLWTLGALVVMHVPLHALHIEETLASAAWVKWVFLVVACGVGLIPDCGPNIVFVTLYANGVIPFSVLLANSIVQDGHGTLPVLAQSRRVFFVVKGVNFLLAFLVGAAVMLAGH